MNIAEKVDLLFTKIKQNKKCLLANITIF